MHLGENQLYPSSIGISPLTTAHPKLLYQQRVRASSPFYRTFTLAMVSSPGFGSTLWDYAPYSDSLSLRLQDYSPLTSPHIVSPWIILQ